MSALLHVLYDMAGRAEDALHLCWENIEDLGQDGGEVYIPPGKAAEGYQDLTQQTMRLLKRLNVSSRAEGAVFSQWQASKNPSNSMRAYLKDNVKRIAPEFASFQTHDLRKSKLRQMLASREFDIAEVQVYGRHKDIRSTQRYVEPDATRLREKMRDLRRVAVRGRAATIPVASAANALAVTKSPLPATVDLSTVCHRAAPGKRIPGNLRPIPKETESLLCNRSAGAPMAANTVAGVTRRATQAKGCNMASCAADATCD